MLEEVNGQLTMQKAKFTSRIYVFVMAVRVLMTICSAGDQLLQMVTNIERVLNDVCSDRRKSLQETSTELGISVRRVRRFLHKGVNMNHFCPVHTYTHTHTHTHNTNNSC
jgi:soluble P-type ATPase